jgi:hypothetical protein
MLTASDGGRPGVAERPFPNDRRKTPDRRGSWRGGRRDSDWIIRPPGALRRFDSLQRRVIQIGKWRIRIPFTSTTREVHPLVGLWALAILGALTFGAARTNYILIEVLYRRVATPVDQQPTPAHNRVPLHT